MIRFSNYVRAGEASISMNFKNAMPSEVPTSEGITQHTASIYVFGDRDGLFSCVQVFGLVFFLVLFLVILIQVGEIRIRG
jgi:hypothetical protein